MSLFVNNRLLAKTMCISAALGRIHTNYVALLWVKFGQPCSKYKLRGYVFLQSKGDG